MADGDLDYVNGPNYAAPLSRMAQAGGGWQGSPFARNLAGVLIDMARGVGNMVSMPGRAMQEGVTTREAVPWAASAATLPMGMGAVAGLPMRAGEAALGAGPIRGRVNDLAMDEASRMVRADAQGFKIDAYKGAYPYDWNTVPEYYGSGKVVPGTENRVPQELTEFDARKFLNAPDRMAGFFSNDPAVASRFAEAMSGSVYPVKLRMQNPKIIDAKGAHAADFQFGPNGNQLRLPPDSPHDGIILKNTKDEGDVYLPRESNQIRSRWAAFDPANKDSGFLLGSGLIGALGGGIPSEQQIIRK